MKYIWSPWRMKYIQNSEKEPGCVLCNALAKPDNAQNLIVMRGERAFVILNKFPYTSGHLMVAPIAHQPTFEALDAPTRAEIMELVTAFTTVLRTIYNPQAFNIGANLGEAAGAGVPGHVHMHIVPRWAGDTSFMSTLGETRVLPEGLDDTYQRVRDAWEATRRS